MPLTHYCNLPVLMLTAGLSALLPRGCHHHSVPKGPHEPPSLTILVTSDIGGDASNLARRAALVDQIRAQSVGLVQVDTGNLLPSLSFEDTPDLSPGAASSLLLGAGPGTPETRARLLLSAYARMGVDALVPGERELALGPEALNELASAFRVTLLAANLARVDGEKVFPATGLIQTSKWPIGIFGIVDLGDAETPTLSRWRLKVTDPLGAARAAAASLRAQGAKLVIGCVHTAAGAKIAQTIAASADGVDAVVVGDGGDGSPPGDSQATGRRPAPVLHAGRGTGSVGRVDVYGPGEMSYRAISAAEAPEQVGVALLVRIESAPVLAHPAPDAPKAPGGVFERWTYSSTNGCAPCHLRETEQYKTTDHAHAFATLNGTKRSSDPACLGCHMTGFLRPGGTQYLDTATTYFADVGCESCHGPSAAHVASPDKKMGTSRKVDPAVCFGCHTPDQTVKPFDYAAALPKILGPGHGR